jgi:hypothetical protein
MLLPVSEVAFDDKDWRNCVYFKEIYTGGHNFECIGYPETGHQCYAYLFVPVLLGFCNQDSVELVGMLIINFNDIQGNSSTFSPGGKTR